MNNRKQEFYHNTGDMACGRMAFYKIGEALRKGDMLTSAGLFWPDGAPCCSGEKIKCGSCGQSLCILTIGGVG